MIASVLALIIFSTLIGVTYAQSTSSINVEANGIEINSFEINPNDIALVFDVNVVDESANVILTFDREFFDAIYNDNDDEFLIIADGGNIRYHEIETTDKARTIKFNLNSDVKTFEIFGSHFMKNTIYDDTQSIIGGKNKIIDELVNENNELSQQLNQQSAANEKLLAENKELDKRIFELENLISAMQNQIDNLNTLVIAQVETIYKWVFPDQ